jgi:hypothetical protein
MSSVRSGAFAVSAAVVVLFPMLALVHASPAPAASMPLGSGETKIALAPGFYKGLRQKGIGVRALGSATLKGRKLTLAVNSGAYDSGAGTGTFGHEGGVRFAAAGKAVVVKKLRLDPSTKSLTAVVADRRTRLASLGGAELEREGFDARLEVKLLRLTGAGASALSRVFGPRAFRAGSSLGSLTMLAEPSEVEPGFGKIALGGPDTTFTKLQGLKVGIGLWGASEVWGEGIDRSFLFPIKPTRVAADASAGIVESEQNDGVTMQIFEPPRREMLLRDPRIDLATRELSATLSPLSTEGAVTGTIGTLDFGGAEVQFRARVGAFELMGIRAISNQFIAEQLNERFSTPGTFQAGETLARMSIILRAS